jgi:hypothetical protein
VGILKRILSKLPRPEGSGRRTGKPVFQAVRGEMLAHPASRPHNAGPNSDDGQPLETVSRLEGGVKRIHEITRDLRFEDIAGRSQILGGSNEVYVLVNREKDDSGRATRAFQLLRDTEPADITQIDIQENDVWLEVHRLFNRQRTGRERPNDLELPLEEFR